MATARSYRTRCIVLRKTKLGEKDLIVTTLAEDGALLRAVAKGARKPGGSLAARLELFCEADVMLAKGRSLDVVTEAKLANPGGERQFGLEQAACAAVVAELVGIVAQEGLQNPRLYEMSRAAFSAIASSEPDDALAVMAADVLKTLASEGFRPSFDACVMCGRHVASDDPHARMALSFEDGGVICDACTRPANAMIVPAYVVSWSKALLYTRFGEVSELGIDDNTVFEVLQFCRQWAQTHAGRDLKSLDFVFTSGLF